MMALLAISFCACSALGRRDAARPSEKEIRRTEALLAGAGFKQFPAESDEERDVLGRITANRIQHYQSGTGIVYWYADPAVCQCLYQGDQIAYDRYAAAEEHKNDLAEYEEQQEQGAQEAAMLNVWGPMWPPPVYYYPGPYYPGPYASGGPPPAPRPKGPPLAPGPPLGHGGGPIGGGHGHGGRH